MHISASLDARRSNRYALPTTDEPISDSKVNAQKFLNNSIGTKYISYVEKMLKKDWYKDLKRKPIQSSNNSTYSLDWYGNKYGHQVLSDHIIHGPRLKSKEWATLDTSQNMHNKSSIERHIENRRNLIQKAKITLESNSDVKGRENAKTAQENYRIFKKSISNKLVLRLKSNLRYQKKMQRNLSREAYQDGFSPDISSFAWKEAYTTLSTANKL